MASKTLKSAGPMTEIGFVNPYSDMMSGWATWEWFEQVPELRWPHSIRTYARMGREDGRLASVLAAVGLPVRRTAWRVAKNGASDAAVAFIAKNLGLPILGDTSEDEPVIERTRDRFSWSQHLQQAILLLTYGHSVFEQVYRPPTGEGDFGDKSFLAKLAPRPAQTIAYWDIARDGGLNFIQQYPEGSLGSAFNLVYDGRSFTKAIPSSRLVVYMRDPDPGVWVGNSMLRPAYKHWLLKDELIRIHAVIARRNGMGIPVATASEAESIAGAGNPKALEPYLKMARNLRGGNNAGAALPFGAKLEIKGVDGLLPSDIPYMIEYHDKQMALAALAHFLNLDKGGSYALASVQADTFTQSVQTLAEIIRDTAQAHVVEDLIDLNFGIDEGCPMLVCDEIGSRQDATAAALQMLVAAGLLTPDRRLEAYERQTLGLPSIDPDGPTLPAPAETAPPALAEPPIYETGVTNAKQRRARGRRITIQPDGALTLW